MAERLEDERRGAARELILGHRTGWVQVLVTAMLGDPRGLRAWSFGTFTFPPVVFLDRHGRPLSVHGMRARAELAWASFVAYAGRYGPLEWVRAEEPHMSELLHYHAVMAGHLPSREVEAAWLRTRVKALEADWAASSAGGQARFRPANPARAAYLAKYVTKGGQLAWSDTFAARWRDLVGRGGDVT